MVVRTREELVGHLEACRSQAVQAMRYRLAMLERRLRNQGVDRALGLLHRRVGRGLQRVDEQEYRLREAIRRALDTRHRTRRALDDRVRRFDVRPRLAAAARRLEAAGTRAQQTIRLGLARRRSRLEQLSAKLSQLSPLRILERGYAIVSNPSGILKDAAAAPAGSRIHVRLAHGELDASVE
jgi:exodeoxyribonuclease VII large subunit